MKNEIEPRHQQPGRLDDFLFGLAYYPEHWDEDDRLKDPSLMSGASVNVVRMAEFAWDRIEPKKGKFDFSLFDEVISKLAGEGISTILCTPTAAPPRWMTDGHDDWLRVDSDGRRMEHASRQHCCINNEQFQAQASRITKAMARHYADNEHVIGWQTDNEFFCHFTYCYCHSCVEGFRRWLKDKYKTSSDLNIAWGTSFWASTYDNFDQIPLPYPQGRPAHPNPSHELDYYRYTSDSVIEFQRQQVAILRAANPKWFITHNIVDAPIDFWKFTEDLDFLSVDIYPAFKIKDPCWAASLNELCRASSGSYVVPEQQSGAGGQKTHVQNTPEPGRMRLWMYQSIAHGADGILHFRWRTCRFGAEMYWNGVIGHDNIPRRRYDELTREGRELKLVGRKILGTTLSVEAGVLIENDQNLAHKTMGQGLPSPKEQGNLAFRELWGRHLPCGLIQADDSFDGLKLLVLPSMPLMDEQFAAKLSAFVENGGVLVVTARSATRDRNNHVISSTPPSLLNELCGVQVEEFGHPEEGELSFSLNDITVEAGRCYEILSLCGAKPIAQWCAAGQNAVTINKFGDGSVIYVGTYLSADNVKTILDSALQYTEIHPLADCHQMVEVTKRRSEQRELLFVLNHDNKPQPITNLPAGTDILSTKACNGQLTLEPYGVAIIE